MNMKHYQFNRFVWVIAAFLVLVVVLQILHSLLASGTLLAFLVYYLLNRYVPRRFPWMERLQRFYYPKRFQQFLLFVFVIITLFSNWKIDVLVGILYFVIRLFAKPEPTRILYKHVS